MILSSGRKMFAWICLSVYVFQQLVYSFVYAQSSGEEVTAEIPSVVGSEQNLFDSGNQGTLPEIMSGTQLGLSGDAVIPELTGIVDTQSGLFLPIELSGVTILSGISDYHSGSLETGYSIVTTTLSRPGVVRDNSLGFVRLRSEATINSLELDTIPSGTSIDIFDEKDGFYRTIFKNQEGWVSKEYINAGTGDVGSSGQKETSIIVNHAQQLVPYALQGDISAELNDMQQPVSADFHKDVIFQMSGATAEIASGMRVQVKNGDPFNLISLAITGGESSSEIEFGISGQHLIFSKPVAIIMATPGYPEGATLQVQVQHAGEQDFGTYGLTTDPSATCNPDGSSSHESNAVKVQNGQVVFYTCGASSFIVNPTANNCGSIVVDTVSLTNCGVGQSPQLTVSVNVCSATTAGNRSVTYPGASNSVGFYVQNACPAGFNCGTTNSTINLPGFDCNTFDARNIIITDANGNSPCQMYTGSSCSVIPVTPQIISPTSGTITTGSAIPLTISGTVGDIVSIYNGSVLVATGIVSAAGSVDIVAGLAAGSNMLTVLGGAGTGNTIDVTYQLPAICGNNIVENVERCDDGNTTNGDGCSSTCTIEVGFHCSVGPLAGPCDSVGQWSVIRDGGLSCNMLYGTELPTSAPTRVMQYNPLTNTVTPLSFTLPGRTRASAMSPDGQWVFYYDDVDLRIEYYNVVTNTFSNGSPLPAAYTTPGNQSNRMGFNRAGQLYMLLKNNLTNAQDLIAISNTGVPTVIGPLTDKAGNTIFVNSLAGGDIIFDNDSRGYVIDNNGSFFKFDTNTLVATYLGDVLGVSSAQAPAGLAYDGSGNVHTFTSVAPAGVYKIDIVAMASTFEVGNGTIFADAFSCAFPDVKPKSSPSKGFYTIVGADVAGLGGTRQATTSMSPGDIIEYEIVIRNSGLTTTTNAKVYDPIPAGTTYVQNSTKLNNIAVADLAGTFLYASTGEVHSPGQAAGVLVPDTTPGVIDKEAVVSFRVKIDDPFLLVPREVVNQAHFYSDDIALTGTCATTSTTGGCTGGTGTVIPIDTGFTNTLPVAVNDTGTTQVNTSLAIFPLTNDSDADSGQNIYVASINGTNIVTGTTQIITVTGGMIISSTTGFLTFVPNSGFVGTVSFPYSISDGNGGTANAIVTIDIINTTPIAVDDIYTGLANTPIPLFPLSGDTDPDGHTLSITSINGIPLVSGTVQNIAVSGGIVTTTSVGGIVFVPNSGFVGTVSFPYTISDGNGGTATANEIITIINRNPDSLDDTGATPANIPVVLNLLGNDSDPDGHPLTITSINGVAITSGTAQTIAVPNGTVTVSATGVVTFIPNPLYTGPVGFPYTIADGKGGTDSANVSIDVLNTDPVALDDVYSGHVGDTILLNPLVNDSDVDGHNPVLTTINGVTLTTGTAQSIPVTGGTVTIDAAGNISFVPNPGFTGTVTIPYTIIDDHGGTATANMIITYDNQAPVAQDNSGSTIANTPVIISVLGNDSDPNGDPLTITEINGTPVTTGSVVAVTGGTVTVNPDGTLTFTPNPGFTGIVDFPYTISDGNGGTDTAQVVITITSDPIAANNDSYTTPSGTPVVLNPLLNDASPLGDDLTITSINGVPLTPGTAQSIPVSGGTVVVTATGGISFVPNPGFTGPVSFPYTIVDEQGVTDNAVISIDVQNADPVANPEIVSTIPNTPVTITPLTNDTDPNGDPLTITEINGTPVTGGSVVPVTGGTITVNPDGTLTFTPNPGFTGDVVVPYTISDGHGGTDTSTITISVETAPLAANPDLYVAEPNATIPLDLLGNDVGSGILTITSINGVTLTSGTAQSIPVTGGTVIVSSTGAISFVAAPGFTGPVLFPYMIADTLGNIDDTTVQIDIANTAPVALDDVTTTNANIPVTLNLLGNDSDPDGHPLTITSINGVTITSGTAQTITVPNGTVTVSATGVVTFIPNPLYTGPVGFPYTIKDSKGGIDTANVRITVLNTDPIIQPDKDYFGYQTPYIINPLKNDSDPDGHPLTITLIDGKKVTPNVPLVVSGGIVIVSITGSVQFIPNQGISGPVTLNYSADDGHGGLKSSTMTFVIPPRKEVLGGSSYEIVSSPVITQTPAVQITPEVPFVTQSVVEKVKASILKLQEQPSEHLSALPLILPKTGAGK